MSTEPTEGLGAPMPPRDDSRGASDGVRDHGAATAAYASPEPHAPAGAQGPGGAPYAPGPGYGQQGLYPPQGQYAPQGQYGGQGGQGGYGPQYQQHQDNGPGFGDRASNAMSQFGRHVKTPETKEFFKTSEFGVWLVTVAAIVIAGAIIDASSHNDVLRADLVWKLVAGISAVYILSRGIAKAGTRRGYGDKPLDRP